MRADPKILLELLELTFAKFRSIVYNHTLLLAALEQTKVSNLQDITRKFSLSIFKFKINNLHTTEL